jgi:hypothetical protein
MFLLSGTIYFSQSNIQQKFAEAVSKKASKIKGEWKGEGSAVFVSA